MNEHESVNLLKRKKATAILCRHLCEIDPGPIGFNVPEDIDNDLEAWCDQCEAILNEEGGWTEHAIEFADLRPCCVGCFLSIKNRMIF